MKLDEIKVPKDYDITLPKAERRHQADGSMWLVAYAVITLTGFLLGGLIALIFFVF